MKQDSIWISERDCDLRAFRREVERETDPQDYPWAKCVEQNVLIYDGARLRRAGTDASARRELQSELTAALMDGPGVLVFRHGFPDIDVVDRATEVFDALIEGEKAAGGGRGDHFAKAGANERVWNALEKMALRAPDVFADYYANDLLALISKAWLGPGYQVTSQVNVVNPGADAQSPHRDYHLGFLSSAQASKFPAHVHRLSPVLTLQGAAAHCDMPTESGPTMYLPYSQRYAAGYLASALPEFRSYFKQHRTQVPLQKGDLAFFNPAVFHAAGDNRTTNIRRMANLLQVSSPLGRSMEDVDRTAMVAALFPVLVRRKAENASDAWLRNVIAACAEGYPFPTNLDRNPPVDGLAPPSQAETVWRALSEGWSAHELGDRLRSGKTS